MILRLKYNGAQVTHRSYGFVHAFGHGEAVGERSGRCEAVPEGAVELPEARMLARVA